ncbi:mitochondrial 54S ribosomal protein mrpl1 [Cichlidogyrus casuarinus]|uniref:Mitochondrial 54S ribosomal protein mrpl1 n=1 Tax=Cichlidogyrus casuarinus TaxID=1844966 RepID=A0ABD2Q4D0_9PLAT
MFAKTKNVTHLQIRTIHSTSLCSKGNQQRYKIAGSSGATKTVNQRREEQLKLKLDQIRKKWIEDMNRRQTLVGTKPETNIYFIKDYEQHFYSLSESMTLIRTAAQPEMFDCLENPLRLTLVLNMKTKKNNKFIQKHEALLTLPYALDFMPPRRVVAICENTEQAEECLKNGAKYAGTHEIIVRLENGSLHYEDYDTIISHSSHEKALTKIRSVLKDRLPKADRLGEDLLPLLQREKSGVMVNSKQVQGIPEINELTVVIGQPSWPDEQISSNIKSYFQALEATKSNRILGKMILEANLSVQPFDVTIPLDITPFQLDCE